MEMPRGTDIRSTAKDTLDTVMETVNNNKLLIGSIAAGCGVAIFLLATETGKRLRNDIQDASLDLYDYVSEQVTNMLSGKDVQQVAENIRKVA